MSLQSNANYAGGLATYQWRPGQRSSPLVRKETYLLAFHADLTRPKVFGPICRLVIGIRSVYVCVCGFACALYSHCSCCCANLTELNVLEDVDEMAVACVARALFSLTKILYMVKINP